MKKHSPRANRVSDQPSVRRFVVLVHDHVQKPQAEARPEEIVQAADDAEAEDEATTNRVGTLKTHTRKLTYPAEAAAAAAAAASPRKKKSLAAAEDLPNETANAFDLLETLVDPEVPPTRHLHDHFLSVWFSV